MKKIVFAIVSIATLMLAASCSSKHTAIMTAAINLSANGTANCYVVPNPGFYYFDATIIGNGQRGIIPGAGFHTDKAGINPASAKVLLNDNNVLSDVRFDGHRVYFRADHKKGNAQIAVCDSNGEVIWSWHIWCTDDPSDVSYTNRDRISWKVMDRNLGALSADPADGDQTFGLYYQWGRKDPFAYGDLAGGMFTNQDSTIAYAVKHPEQALNPVTWKDVYDAFDWYAPHKDKTNHALWGNPDFAYCHPLSDMVKTIYDPCPVGYVVAPTNAFIDFEVAERMEFLDNGFYFKGDNGVKCFFPYAGGIYTGVKLDRPDMTVGTCAALWNSASARFIYWDDGGSRSVVYKDTHEARNYYGDTRACCYPVRCVRQAQ
ncbi:MAG: hypothetical protein J5801_05460 [Bacteroidales bacterium]|nr:hypothetical protein [Bacteroidales bacterium]